MSTLIRVTPPIDIIIPVFRGFLETRRCIESVLASSVRTDYELVVVEDCSPDPELVDYLKTLSEHGRITLLQNAENLGFVATVNRGMQLHADRDVLLLNSDTEVANDWFDRLHAAAYSAEEIGTVTPFSNNATICSYPYFNGVGAASLPSDISLAELDILIAKTNAGQTAEIPTAVGFCMFIKRDCLNEVGYFDEKRFGRGYGEENDFSRNAALLGWRNVLAADVFVFHVGGVSFSSDQPELQQKALIALLDKHPDYLYVVSAFVRHNPLHRYRIAIDGARSALNTAQSKLVATEQSVEEVQSSAERVKNSGGGVRLHITHSWGGGIERWIENYVIEDANNINLILASTSDHNMAGIGYELSVYFSGRKIKISKMDLATPIPNTAISHQEYENLLDEIINLYGIGAIIISSFIGHALSVLNTRLQTLVILHDMYPFCPAIFASYNNTSCSECDLQAIRTCHKKNPLDLFWSNSKPEWWIKLRFAYEHRIAAEWVRLIAPSRYAYDHLIQLLPSLGQKECNLISHGISNDLIGQMKSDFDDTPQRSFRVLVPGRLHIHKGLGILKELIPLINNHCEVLLLGSSGYGFSFDGMNNVTVIPHYDLKDLPAAVKRFNPDVALLPSTVPESFSYILSEMLALHVPVIATDMGAFKERITDGETGWLVTPTAQEFARIISKLSADPARMSAVKSRLDEISVLSIGEMVSQYNSLIENTRPAAGALLSSLQSFANEDMKTISKISDLNDTLVSKDEKIKEGKDLAQSLQNALDEMSVKHEKVAANLDQVHDQIAQILNSRSWRLTSLLRGIFKTIRGLARSELNRHQTEPNSDSPEIDSSDADASKLDVSHIPEDSNESLPPKFTPTFKNRSELNDYYQFPFGIIAIFLNTKSRSDDASFVISKLIEFCSAELNSLRFLIPEYVATELFETLYGNDLKFQIYKRSVVMSPSSIDPLTMTMLSDFSLQLTVEDSCRVKLVKPGGIDEVGHTITTFECDDQNNESAQLDGIRDFSLKVINLISNKHLA